ncbi:MAG: hypothetical protein BMS9Abin11_1784 [Gammaproteobacteria bacterium]|nr:MAG: hypothetical protein BMS9Abin11_1784 [Gammaproteobacteria bacterium]
MEQKIINKLRKYYDLPAVVTDDQIEKDCEDSLGHALIRLNIAVTEYKTAIKNSLPQWLKRLIGIDV